MNTEPDKEEQEPLPLPPGFVIGELPKPAPVKYKRRKKRRKKKPGRPRTYFRESPSKREGLRHYTVTVEEVVYLHIKELKKFYKLTSMSKTIAKFIEPAFEKVLQDSQLLLKIAQRKEKEREEAQARIAAYRASKGSL